MPRKRVWLGIKPLQDELAGDQEFADAIKKALKNENDDRVLNLCHNELGLDVFVTRDNAAVGNRPNIHLAGAFIVLNVPENGGV